MWWNEGQVKHKREMTSVSSKASDSGFQKLKLCLVWCVTLTSRQCVGAVLF